MTLRIIVLLGFVAAAVVGAMGLSLEARASTVESRFYLQVRNVKPGGPLRLEITNQEVLNLLVADVRMSGVAESLADDDVAVEGNTLIVQTSSKPRLNLNLTLYAVCRAQCPSVLTGVAEVPHASYSMLRTSKQDVTLTQSGDWTIRLIN